MEFMIAWTLYKVSVGYKFKQQREDLALVISVVNISLSWKTYSLLKSLQSLSTGFFIKTNKQTKNKTRDILGP